MGILPGLAGKRQSCKGRPRDICWRTRSCAFGSEAVTVYIVPTGFPWGGDLLAILGRFTPWEQTVHFLVFLGRGYLWVRYMSQMSRGTMPGNLPSELESSSGVGSGADSAPDVADVPVGEAGRRV